MYVPRGTLMSHTRCSALICYNLCSSAMFIRVALGGMASARTHF
jgi:hypothetical protein